MQLLQLMQEKYATDAD